MEQNGVLKLKINIKTAEAAAAAAEQSRAQQTHNESTPRSSVQYGPLREPQTADGQSPFVSFSRPFSSRRVSAAMGWSNEATPCSNGGV